MCYLRGIFGASLGRSGAEESCYKGTKKNVHTQVFGKKNDGFSILRGSGLISNSHFKI